MNPYKNLAYFVSASLCLFTTQSWAEMFFPTEFLNTNNNGEIADLSKFSADGSQLPGQYQVDIYVNDNYIKNRVVNFISLPVNSLSGVKDSSGLLPCLSLKDLSDAGVKTELFPGFELAAENNCIELTQYIPAAFYSFSISKLRLDVSIPQMYVRNTSQGYIDPTLWDNGITAAFLNYNLSGNNRVASTFNNKSYFLNLGSGVNIGPWRLRDYRAWNYYESQYGRRQQWQRINSYLERAVIPLKSTFIAGEGTTSGDIFDALRFRGIQLATDDNMYPDTMRGFAPVVRGTAESNAEVTIMQSGYTIYKTSVPPGPFEINDLNSMMASGDLNVTVKEASGQVRTFTVPYTSVPVLLRESRLKYGLTAARYRSASGSRYESPEFLQGTLAWGGPHDVTLYGGIQYSADYRAIQSGAGVNLGRLGAVSADITHANSTLTNGKDYTGQSVRFLYARSFNETGTRFRLTGYRYSTKGFHTLDETALKRMSGRLSDPNALDENGNRLPETYDYYNLNNSKRARFEANISQSVGSFGSFWLSGVRQTFWNDGASNDSLQIGYSSTVGPASFSINYGYSRQKSTGASSFTDKTIGLSVSVPLEKLFGSSSDTPSVYATFYGSRDGQGNTRSMAGVSGTLLEDRNLDWSASHSIGGGAQSQSGNASVSYKAKYGNAGVGYNYARDYQQISYNASGGMILHRDGLTLGQPLGETSVLIATDGVSDVSIQNEPGVRTDWRGFTIKPYTSAYRENRVAVDTQALDDETDLADGGVANVVPTKGAIVRTDFNVRRGQRILFTLMHKGKVLPFGTVVTTVNSTGLVGDDGQVYMAGMPERGEISAKWGKDSGQSCTTSYSLSDMTKTSVINRITAECQ
ncbi:fimbria/pilus outer membrane usher protein [Raoultella terrigena]|uniref:fimbria/pilus outer membrane usher protein n=1 Tax=Raoultella terrigena TaxID=577 RepID=UPI0011425EFE|nr:fimbria/pilus outer membrane usher protein [Raoultella terrigena]